MPKSYKIKTFLFDMTKTRTLTVVEKEVNGFLETVIVEGTDDVVVNYEEPQIFVSVVYRDKLVKKDKR